MPALKNPKHERYAQEIASGRHQSQAKAYVAAGFKAGTGAGVSASKLLATPKVRARVDEILAARQALADRGLERAIERTAITKQRVLEELARIGFANMLDYMQVGPQGDPVLDFSKLSRDQAAALVEVTVEDFLDGRGEDARQVRRVKFKLADKRQALVDLGIELGMFVKRREVKQVDEFDRMTKEELQRFIATGEKPARYANGHAAEDEPEAGETRH